jgi:hypothetical protein
VDVTPSAESAALRPLIVLDELAGFCLGQQIVERFDKRISINKIPGVSECRLHEFPASDAGMDPTS